MTTAAAPASGATPRILGSPVDSETRCTHYRSELDVVALKFKCCGEYYPCFACHEESSGHPIARWESADLRRLAVLCGVCRTELRIEEYLSAEDCPSCTARFNPGCRLHHRIYFDFDTEAP
ncbi:hypothetical protein J4H92_05780 [Leucobacter weissii]|uniref:CHY-type domain-containing protein n=1 Tax=Leucobacter weissii TaxID=1983706 RepID=A0A939MJ00_9MICO|nr:CHY zinc finger protein [Leucobacter weissii]MBO1901456.1 hypothetical protein [Leucobacter weissii]